MRPCRWDPGQKPSDGRVGSFWVTSYKCTWLYNHVKIETLEIKLSDLLREVDLSCRNYLGLLISLISTHKCYHEYLYELMDTNKTYCGSHFAIYVSQVITLHTLNLHGAVCQF